MVAADDSLGGLACRLHRLTRSLSAEAVLVVPVCHGLRLDPVVVAVGTGTRVTVEPSVVLRPVLRLRATSMIVAHNHLGDAPVSAEDRAVTRRLVAAGVVVGVPLQAHLVLGRTGWADCCRPGDELTPYADGLAA